LRGAICRWYFGIEVSTSLLLQTVSIFVPSISSRHETIVFAALNAGSRFVNGIEYELRSQLRSVSFRAGLVLALGAGATR
jgi:hypothetical protein